MSHIAYGCRIWIYVVPGCGFRHFVQTETHFSESTFSGIMLKSVLFITCRVIATILQFIRHEHLHHYISPCVQGISKDNWDSEENHTLTILTYDMRK